MSDTTITLDKPEIVARLTKQVQIATEADRRAAVEHKRAETDYLARFRKMCREAASWTYAEAKAAGFDVIGNESYPRRQAGLNLGSPPSCPTSQAGWIAGELQRVEMSKQDTYKTGPNSSLHKALVWSPVKPKGVCD